MYYLSQNGVRSGIGVCAERVMKIPLIAQSGRQNASAPGLALFFPPLQARLKQRFFETAHRAGTTSALRPALARKHEREL
eukprot:503828-Pleurochrysis_carterae.AAC.1